MAAPTTASSLTVLWGIKPPSRPATCTLRAPRYGNLRSLADENGQVTASAAKPSNSCSRWSKPCTLTPDWWSGAWSNCRPSAFQGERRSASQPLAEASIADTRVASSSLLDCLGRVRRVKAKPHAVASRALTQRPRPDNGSYRGGRWRPTGFVDNYIMPLAPFSCQFRVHTRRASDTPVPSESSDDCSTLPRTRTKPASHARRSSMHAGG